MTLTSRIVEVRSVSTRIAYLVLQVTERYFLNVRHVYAPSSAHCDEEVEALYGDITRANHVTTSAFYNVVMEDFNVKVGNKTAMN